MKKIILFLILSLGFYQGAFATTIPTTGLIGRWNLTSNATDTSVTALTGTTAYPSYYTGVTFGSSGAVFNGTNGKIFVSTHNPSSYQLSTSQSFSISAWIKTNSVTNSAYYLDNRIFQLNSYTNNVEGNIGFGVSAGKIKTFFRDSNGNLLNPVSTASVNDGLWNQVTLVYDGGTKTLSIYINGNFDNSQTNSSMNGVFGGGGLWTDYANGRNYPTTIGFGQNGSDVGFFDGNIQQVLVYSRAITAYEVQDIMLAPLGGSSSSSCSDGIKNQDETSIDFGGVCGGTSSYSTGGFICEDKYIQIGSGLTNLNFGLGLYLERDIDVVDADTGKHHVDMWFNDPVGGTGVVLSTYSRARFIAITNNPTTFDSGSLKSINNTGSYSSIDTDSRGTLDIQQFNEDGTAIPLEYLKFATPATGVIAQVYDDYMKYVGDLYGSGGYALWVSSVPSESTKLTLTQWRKNMRFTGFQAGVVTYTNTKYSECSNTEWSCKLNTSYGCSSKYYPGNARGSCGFVGTMCLPTTDLEDADWSSSSPNMSYSASYSGSAFNPTSYSGSSEISLKNAFTTCPAELENVDIGFLTILTWGFDIHIPILDYDLSFHPFSGAGCAFKSFINGYNKVTSLY